MREREIDYDVRGVTLGGYLAVPDGAADPGPGVLVAPGALGLDEFARAQARRLAALGLTALAFGYYSVELGDPWGLGPRMEDPTPLRAIAEAALAALLTHAAVDADRVAAVGYCFGGQVVLELARSGAPIQAVVGFHPVLFTARPQDAADIRGRVLVCVGSEDPYVGVDDRAAFEHEMRTAGVDWRLELFGGVGHNFTNPDADPDGMEIRFDAPAARASWRAMLDLFDQTIRLPH